MNCKCGCGKRVNPGRRFIHGHNRRGKCSGKDNPMYGKKLSSGHRAKISEALSGENHPMYGKKHSLKTIAKISTTKKGIPLSDAHKIILSTTTATAWRDHPEAWDEAIENMQGGDDIVNHHYIYDHDDLTKYIMRMTRKEHGKLHRNMQIIGLKVPHINKEVE